MISSDWLRAFIVFAETMNFTRAAARLHISQPALHVQIRKLGESVQAPLYVRQGRSLSLTEQGRKLLAFGREQLERTELLLEEVRGTQRAPHVVLAAGEGTFLNLLGPALHTFQRGKHAKLRVLTRDREEAIASVQLGEAHVAVTVADEVPANLLARRVAKVGVAAILPKGHALARKRQVSIRDLRGEAVIAPTIGRPLRAALARAWADIDAAWAPAVEANGWEVMMRFAALGMGIAIVNDFCTPPRGTVRRPLHGLPSVQYQLLRLKQREPTAAVLALEAAILTS